MQPHVLQYVFESELTDGLVTLSSVLAEADLTNVTFGDSDFTLLSIAAYREKVLNHVADDVSEYDLGEVNSRLDKLPVGTYIDLENRG